MGSRRMNYAILALLLVLVFISGCTQNVGSGASLYTDQYRSDMKRIAISSPSMYEDCKVGVCWCMACKNGTNLFLPMTSLIGGSCYFQSNCNQQVSTALSDKTASPSVSMRPFMLGQGPTIADFAAAQPYCAQGLTMAVQWLVGTKDTPYTMPSAERSMCLLGVDVMPVYVMYSNGTNLNASRAYDIGQELGENGKNVFQGKLTSGPVGPVVVVTEMDFNISEASQVADEVKEVNAGCGNVRSSDSSKSVLNCLVAVAPKLNDTAALDAVLKLAGPDNVDLVAFGVNGHYVHTCDPGAISMQVLNYAGYALYNDSKPSIIPYMMFEPSGTDVDNSCTWNEQSVDSAYSSLFSIITPLRNRGVIGIAPYSFNTSSSDISNPLGCQNCGVAMTSSRMNSWYANCQNYASKPDASGNPEKNPGLSITYADQPGGACLDNFQNFNIAYKFQTKYDSTQGTPDIMNPITPTLQDPKVPQLYSCSDCISQNASGSPPFAFTVKSGAPPASNCTAIPQIDTWASMRNLDPMFVRAIAYSESGLDPCAAAKVCSASCLGSSCTSGCFPAADASGNSECYSKGYDAMYDPAAAGSQGSCPDFSNDIVPSGQAPAWRWCGLGLMQSVEPPYTFWPDSYLATGLTPGTDNPYKDIFTRSGFGGYSSGTDPYYPLLVSALSCDSKFNPFDPGDSLCMGTLKLERMVRQGYAWIENHPGLGFTYTGADTEKAKVFAYYVASEMYRGWWGADTRNDFQAAADFPSCVSGQSNGDCWTQAFTASRAVTDATCNGQPDSYQCKGGKPNWNPPYYCYGATDFVSFVQSCFDPISYSADPGNKYMSTYYWFNNNCGNSFCPYGKALLKQIPNQQMPASGNPYIPDSLTTPVTSP